MTTATSATPQIVASSVPAPTASTAASSPRESTGTSQDHSGWRDIGRGSVIASPRRWRQLDRARQVELDAEAAAFGIAWQRIGEPLAGGDLDRPDVRGRRRDERSRLGVREELEARACGTVPRRAAVLRDAVRAAVLVAVVVLEHELAVATRDDPGARAVGADVERNADLAVRAVTHVHDEAFGPDRRVSRRRA